MKRFLKWLAIVVALMGVLLIALYAWVGRGFRKAFEEATETQRDPGLYSGIVESHASASTRYGFLPKQVPPAAIQIAFFYVPGFLQGGDVICLRVKLPKHDLEAILKELEQSGRNEISDFGQILGPDCYPKFGISKSGGATQYDGDGSLPPGFRVFLFQTDLADIKKNWNHNFMAFTAVSLERQEVVYYVDNW